jgi:hypothetical protein
MPAIFMHQDVKYTRGGYQWLSGVSNFPYFFSWSATFLKNRINAITQFFTRVVKLQYVFFISQYGFWTSIFWPKFVKNLPQKAFFLLGFDSVWACKPLVLFILSIVKENDFFCNFSTTVSPKNPFLRGKICNFTSFFCSLEFLPGQSPWTQSFHSEMGAKGK